MSLWQRMTRIGKQALGDDFPDTPPGFEKDYRQASTHGCFCSSWGTSKYYIDSDHNMYVGRGELKGRLYDVIGVNRAHDLKTISFMEPVKAPIDSSRLLSETEEIYTSEHNFLHTINGLDKMDTSQVQDMRGMFANDCFLRSLDLSNWDTSQVRDMGMMFHHLSNLTGLNVSDWNTEQVQDMRGTFDGANSLPELDLRNWRTEQVTDMSWMFTDTRKLGTLDLSNFDMSNVQDTNAMFLWMNDSTIIKMSPKNSSSKIPFKGSSIQNKSTIIK